MNAVHLITLHCREWVVQVVVSVAAVRTVVELVDLELGMVVVDVVVDVDVDVVVAVVAVVVVVVIKMVTVFVPGQLLTVKHLGQEGIPLQLEPL